MTLITSILRQRMPRYAASAIRPGTISTSSSYFSASHFSSAATNNNGEDLEDNEWDNDEEVAEEGEWTGCTRRFLKPIEISVRGSDILTDPLFNKSTAFKSGARDRLRLRGLLPPKVANIDFHKKQFLHAFREEKSDIAKHMMLEDLHDRNETLYHRVIVDHIEEMCPLIYTPTVGQACKEFAMRWRRPRGMYFTRNDRGYMASMLYNWPHKDVHVIVVTDGSRILGLGDLGSNGMGIPIGKLSLYCAAGGIAPHRVLPVVLDVGTDNEELLNDEFYLGVKEKRLKGREYFHLVNEFMQAVRHRWPNVLVQFEDFSSDKAQRLLNHYRNDHLVFNDDIQGTGATTLAGILGALRAKGHDVNTLGDERIVIAGAGSAGIGVAQVLKQAMIEQGRTEEEARNRFYICDQFGLMGNERSSELSPEQAEFARSEDGGLPLLDVVKKIKPTILLGMTTVGGLFNEELVKEMAKHCERPIIFPLSNPTTKAECTAEDAFTWTKSKCIFASGSPFDPVTLADGRTLYPTQCNNMYVFPGLGLGVTVCGAKTISDRMLYVAAEALANYVSQEELAQGKVFPSISDIRHVSHSVAVAVIREAIVEGQATELTPKQEANLEDYVYEKMYFPRYVPIIEKRNITI